MDTEYKQLPESTTSRPSQYSPEADSKQQKRVVIGLVIVAIVVLAVLITGLVFLLSPNTTAVTVARIRDVFIIIMALESLLVGLVLVLLMIQLARLINLLQNEVQPILDSTNETVSNLRGTTEFISENLVEPIIKLNEYLAGMQKVTEIFRFKRKK